MPAPAPQRRALRVTEALPASMVAVIGTRLPFMVLADWTQRW